MQTDDMIDIVTTVIILAILIPITVSLARPFYRNELGGFGVQIEKTALKTQGELLPNNKDFNSNDTMLLLAVADEYFPEPKIIEINGTVINIDSVFFTNRIPALQSAYAAMPTVRDMNIQLYVGKDIQRKWVISNE
ncbi:hypothetical protein [Vallitalea guaymasensis]|uniref:Uncharacterized protein n=1 Tax=Vallitalea guaymasensis TaxID=1185412 RepID=A0A8J8M9Z8_9FIRM|nr:hypothetical protein [Vallitalea guaymasensis]QUH29117.1 hypothetical protein HYG85_09350 [Vallitalea guaymasensis]